MRRTGLPLTHDVEGWTRELSRSWRRVFGGASAGLILMAVVILAGQHGARAAPTGHGSPDPAKAMEGLTSDQKWARRFPQPVLVSDVIGRLILDQKQGVLGTIQTLVHAPDGSIMIVFARRRLLLFRGETVVVPEHATALLGPFVMILDRTSEEIERLPPFEPAGTSPVDRKTKIRMALTKN